MGKIEASTKNSRVKSKARDGVKNIKTQVKLMSDVWAIMRGTGKQIVRYYNKDNLSKVNASGNKMSGGRERGHVQN